MDQEIRIMASPSMGDPTQCAFTVDRPVYPDRAFYFAGKEKAEGSPVVEALFELPGVAAVLVAHDTLTVWKDAPEDWPTLGKKIGEAIRGALQTGETPVAEGIHEQLPPPEQIQAVVQQILDERVNPSLAMHGGSVRLLEVRENNVYLQLGGGCQGCGMASATLKGGIERLLREMVPEVGEVLDVTDHASGRNPYFQDPQG
jgi:Fe-S cluster biogenesis protein NfuA